MTDTLFDTLMATAVDGIVVVDEGCIVRTYNAACERMFGYAAHEVIGQNIAILVPETSSESPGKPVGSTPNDALVPANDERELIGKRKDGGTFPILFTF